MAAYYFLYVDDELHGTYERVGQALSVGHVCSGRKPWFVLTAQEGIRHEYHACRMGYDNALAALMETGMSDCEADKFLFCRN